MCLDAGNIAVKRAAQQERRCKASELPARWRLALGLGPAQSPPVGSEAMRGVMTQFFFPLPGVSLEDRERLYGVWAKFCGKQSPPPHERIFRIWFSYQGRELFAQVGMPISPGEPPVVAIYGGDPLVVYRLGGEAFEVPSPRARDAEYFDASEEQ
jgi:hypothetical protein